MEIFFFISGCNIVTTGNVPLKLTWQNSFYKLFLLSLRALTAAFQKWDVYLVLDIKNHIQLSEPWLGPVGCPLFVPWLGPPGLCGVLLGLKLQTNGALPFPALLLLFTWKVLQEGAERKGVSGFKVFYLPQESAWHREWHCWVPFCGMCRSPAGWALWGVPVLQDEHCCCSPAGWALLQALPCPAVLMCCPVAGWCSWLNWQGQCCCPSLPAGSRSAPTWNKSCKYSEDSFPLTEACLRHACFLLPPTALSCILRSLEKPSAWPLGFHGGDAARGE